MPLPENNNIRYVDQRDLRSLQRQRAYSAPAVSFLKTGVKYKNGIYYPNCQECVSHRQYVMVRSGYNPHQNHKHLSSNGHCSRTDASGQPRRLSTIQKMSKHKESFEAKCCHINVLLVVMQMFLGIIIVALAFYMQTITSSLSVRDTPYWAGIPLGIAGIIGTFYFCLIDSNAYSGSKKTFLIKTALFVLSSISIFVTVVASIFPGIHGGRIPSLKCNFTDAQCFCSIRDIEDSRTYVYSDLKTETCDVIYSALKDYLILQCAFNAIGCTVSIWLVLLLWKSRYAQFHAGLKFYSYSANNTQNPWINPAKPPYPIEETPSFDRKLSQKQILLKQESSLQGTQSTSSQNAEIEEL